MFLPVAIFRKYTPDLMLSIINGELFDIVIILPFVSNRVSFSNRPSIVKLEFVGIGYIRIDDSSCVGVVFGNISLKVIATVLEPSAVASPSTLFTCPTFV